METEIRFTWSCIGRQSICAGKEMAGDDAWGKAGDSRDGHTLRDDP